MLVWHIRNSAEYHQNCSLWSEVVNKHINENYCENSGRENIMIGVTEGKLK